MRAQTISRIIAAIVSIIAAGQVLFAVPAIRRPFQYTQPDGSVIMLQRHGDEWGHWTTNQEGQVVVEGEDGFYRVLEGVAPAQAAHAAAMRRQARRKTMSKSPVGRHIALGKKHFLVILVEFSDKKFLSTSTREEFDKMLNTPGFKERGHIGSARDFYFDNSHGVFEPVFDVFGPVTLPKEMAYYGGNDSNGYDKNPGKALVDGLDGLKNQIDLSDYDLDGDGLVDLVFWYYAGKGEADGGSSNTIWPHQWTLRDQGLEYSDDGKRVEAYACASELQGYGTYAGQICGIGTACHEFGHAMGLPDFYDADYDDNGYALGMANFSTMDGGSYNGESRIPPYLTINERIILGWVDESVLRPFPASGTYKLESLNENVAYVTETDKQGEYFVYECRDGRGWDSALNAKGLVVTHVDRSDNRVGQLTAKEQWDLWETYNSINQYGNHPCCYVVAAPDQNNLKYGCQYYSEYGTYFDEDKLRDIPFPGAKNVTTYTAVSWNGAKSSVELKDIAFDGTCSSFTVTMPSSELDFHTIDNPGAGQYEVGGVLPLKINEAETRPVSSVKWYCDGSELGSTNLQFTSAGVHKIRAVLTLQDGGTQTLTLEVEVR